MVYRPLTRDELMILTAIVALAQGLPGELGDYTEALGELRRKYFVRGRTRGEKVKGFVEDHQPRVRERWQ